MEERNGYIIYNADDEETDCGRCDHVCDSEKWCSENCGPEYGWSNYIRTERVEDNDKTYCIE